MKGASKELLEDIRIKAYYATELDLSMKSAEDEKWNVIKCLRNEYGDFVYHVKLKYVLKALREEYGSEYYCFMMNDRGQIVAYV